MRSARRKARRRHQVTLTPPHFLLHQLCGLLACDGNCLTSGPVSCNAVRLNSSGRKVRYRSTATNSVEGSRCSRRATSASVATPRSVAYQVISALAKANRRCRDRERTSLLSNPNVQLTVSITWSSEYAL